MNTQLSGFYPIEEKHSSIEHLFLKVESKTLHRRKGTLQEFSRSFRYRGIRTSGFWRMDTWNGLSVAGFVGTGARLRSDFWVSWLSLTWSSVRFARVGFMMSVMSG